MSVNFNCQIFTETTCRGLEFFWGGRCLFDWLGFVLFLTCDEIFAVFTKNILLKFYFLHNVYFCMITVLGTSSKSFMGEKRKTEHTEDMNSFMDFLMII